jgi:hypothetical protein
MGSFDNFAHGAIRKSRAKKKPAEPSIDEISQEASDMHGERMHHALRENPDADFNETEKRIANEVHEEMVAKYPSYARYSANQNLSHQQQQAAARPRVQGNPYADMQARNND